MSHHAFSGIITAIATPFTRGGKIDEAAFCRMVNLQKRAGIHGILITGTTGENPTVTDLERERLVSLALEERADHFHIYVNAGTNSTTASVEATVRCAAYRSSDGAGIDGILAVVPYYNKPTQLGLFEHFCAISRAVPSLPVAVYNVPSRTSSSILPQTFRKIAVECPNVLAIKEAAGDLRVISELVAECRTLLSGQMTVLSGDDATFAPALLCGAGGLISVAANVIPGTMLAMLEAAQTGDFGKLSSLHEASFPLLSTGLFVVANPVPLKWILGQLGVCEDVVRLPLAQIDGREADLVRHAMQSVEKAGIRFLV